MVGLSSADALKNNGGVDDFKLELDDGADLSDPDTKPWVPDFELEEGEDSMTRLGYGVVSYFGLIYTFMRIFFMITCVNIPNMYNNFQWSAFTNMSQLSWTSQYTVGNLGQSSTHCINVKVLSQSISLSCYTGLLAEITHFGAY